VHKRRLFGVSVMSVWVAVAVGVGVGRDVRMGYVGGAVLVCWW
jgi:hypothetical protein